MTIRFDRLTAGRLSVEVADPFFWRGEFSHLISSCVVLKRTVSHAQRPARRRKELPHTVMHALETPAPANDESIEWFLITTMKLASIKTSLSVFAGIAFDGGSRIGTEC